MGEFSINQAIQEFLKQSRIKGGIQALQIEDVKHELIYQKEKIRQRVNEALGQKVVNEVIVQ